MEEKMCKACNVVKPFSEFNNHKITKDKKNSNCKSCVSKKHYEKKYGIGCHIPKKIKLGTLLIDGDLEIAKECIHCEIIKPLSYFHQQKGSLGDRTASCKPCLKKFRESESRKKVKVLYDKKYQEENKEEIKRKRRENPYENQRTLNYYYANHEENKKKHRLYGEKNKEKISEYHRMHYKKNAEKFKAHRDAYYASEQGKEAARKAGHRRRTRGKETFATLTHEQWVECVVHFNKQCAYCGKVCKMTVEHFVPLSKGGELAVKNIIPVCLSCNCSKNNKDFIEWYPKQPFYSESRERQILKYLGYKDKQQQIALF